MRSRAPAKRYGKCHFSGFFNSRGNALATLRFVTDSHAMDSLIKGYCKNRFLLYLQIQVFTLSAKTDFYLICKTDVYFICKTRFLLYL